MPGILGARCGVLAEAPRLGLHRAHLRPNLFQPQRRVHPNRLAMHEPANVVPPDQRNVPAEFLLLQLDQTPAVANLFLAHLLENLRRAGKVPPQVFTKIGVDTFRLFLERNCQSKDFLLRQDSNGTFRLLICGQVFQDGPSDYSLNGNNSPRLICEFTIGTLPKVLMKLDRSLVLPVSVRETLISHSNSQRLKPH